MKGGRLSVGGLQMLLWSRDVTLFTDGEVLVATDKVGDVGTMSGAGSPQLTALGFMLQRSGALPAGLPALRGVEDSGFRPTNKFTTPLAGAGAAEAARHPCHRVAHRKGGRQRQGPPGRAGAARWLLHAARVGFQSSSRRIPGSLLAWLGCVWKCLIHVAPCRMRPPAP
jgi:hypothetical protein